MIVKNYIIEVNCGAIMTEGRALDWQRERTSGGVKKVVRDTKARNVKHARV